MLFNEEDMKSEIGRHLADETVSVNHLFDPDLPPLVDFNVRIIIATILHTPSDGLRQIFAGTNVLEQVLEIKDALDRDYDRGIRQIGSLIIYLSNFYTLSF